MIEKRPRRLPAFISDCLAQPPGYQSCSNYPLLVASEGLEPSLQGPKSCVRPSHREAERFTFSLCRSVCVQSCLHLSCSRRKFHSYSRMRFYIDWVCGVSCATYHRVFALPQPLRGVGKTAGRNDERCMLCYLLSACILRSSLCRVIW